MTPLPKIRGPSWAILAALLPTVPKNNPNMNRYRITLVALVLAVVAGPSLVAAPGPASPASLAERVSRLHLSVEADEEALRHLEEADSGPGGEYQTAEREFKALAATLREKEKAHQTAQAEGRDAAAAQQELFAAQKKWQESREKFNLAIEHRHMRQAQA